MAAGGGSKSKAASARVRLLSSGEEVALKMPLEEKREKREKGLDPKASHDVRMPLGAKVLAEERADGAGARQAGTAEACELDRDDGVSESSR